MITEEQIRGSIKGQLKSNAAICLLKCVRLTITDTHNKKGTRHKLYQNIINSLRLIFLKKNNHANHLLAFFHWFMSGRQG